MKILQIALKELLDVMHEYGAEVHPNLRAMLFGGLGKFVMSYHDLRADLNDPMHSFQMALGAVHDDRRIQALFGQTAEAMVDRVVPE